MCVIFCFLVHILYIELKICLRRMQEEVWITMLRNAYDRRVETSKFVCLHDRFQCTGGSRLTVLTCSDVKQSNIQPKTYFFSQVQLKKVRNMKPMHWCFMYTNLCAHVKMLWLQFRDNNYMHNFELRWVRSWRI